MVLATLRQDPDEVTNRSIDWSARLASGDSVATSNWVGEAGITIVDLSYAGSVASVRISGGTAGNSYSVTNTVTTANGETLEEVLLMKIEAN